MCIPSMLNLYRRFMRAADWGLMRAEPRCPRDGLVISASSAALLRVALRRSLPNSIAPASVLCQILRSRYCLHRLHALLPHPRSPLHARTQNNKKKKVIRCHSGSDPPENPIRAGSNMLAISILPKRIRSGVSTVS